MSRSALSSQLSLRGRCSQIKPAEAWAEIPARSHGIQHPQLPRLRPQDPSGASAHKHGCALLSFSSPGPAGQAGLASTRGLPPGVRFLHRWHLNRRLGLRMLSCPRAWQRRRIPRALRRGRSRSGDKHHPLTVSRAEQERSRGRSRTPASGSLFTGLPLISEIATLLPSPDIFPPSGLGRWMKQGLGLVPRAWEERVLRPSGDIAPGTSELRARVMVRLSPALP